VLLVLVLHADHEDGVRPTRKIVYFVASDDSILIAAVPLPQHVLSTGTLLLAEVLNDELPFNFPPHSQPSVLVEIWH